MSLYDFTLQKIDSLVLVSSSSHVNNFAAQKLADVWSREKILTTLQKFIDTNHLRQLKITVDAIETYVLVLIRIGKVEHFLFAAFIATLLSCPQS